jgi:hypothetical protein
LGDLSYLSEEMFIMERIGKCEVVPTVDHDLIRVYNTMPVKYGMQLEWDRWFEKEMEIIYEKV